MFEYQIDRYGMHDVMQGPVAICARCCQNTMVRGFAGCMSCKLWCCQGCVHRRTEEGQLCDACHETD